MRAVLPWLSALLVLLVAAVATAAPRPTLGVATPIEDPGHVGLQRYYTALRATGGGGVARALHYGDSTIASDGFTRTVRGRLAARFGDAGPGFVTAAFDPTWNDRSDVDARRSGSWSWRTILLGGAGGRYGLGGVVGIARSASVSVRALDAAEATVPQKHLEVWYQTGAGYGTFWAKVDDVEVAREPAVSAETGDARFVLDRPEGFSTVTFGASGGTVPFYGVVLERGAPGITWEALGVTGVGSRSFTAYATEHLPGQMAQRKPDLVVIMLGGNEAGFPVLSVGSGAGYAPIFEGALDTIRAGAPDASCLVVTPLDQGFVDDTDPAAPIPRSRPGMPNMVARQREVAHANGCAFWSTWDAMGGKGAALRWAAAPGIGTGDYVHVTARGLDVLGNLLADALLADYDAWAAATP